MRAAFEHVNAWVFDLDNTLYPYDPGRWTHVEQEMTDWIARELSLPREEARRLQKAYLEKYGLTAIGLAREHGVSAARFMTETHDHLPILGVGPDPVLREALAGLPGRRFIHTNAHPRHAERALGMIGIADLFDGIFSFVDLDMIPKPERRAFERAAEKGGYDPRRAAMFEDAARNLVAPHAMGMRTVLIPSGCDWASAGADGSHIDYVAHNLAAFLRSAGGG